MSTPMDSPGRGCVAAYNEPVNEAEVLGAKSMVDRCIYNPPYDLKNEYISTETLSHGYWSISELAQMEYYVTGALRSFRTNEAYIFMDNEYVLFNYAPSMTGDFVINGPLYIRDGFPSLEGTDFVESGIESAFGSHDGNEAFIFSGNLCAYIDYAPHSMNDKIIKGPMNITRMFPFFKGTVFDNGADAAFESHKKYEAYLFNGNLYALINYKSLELIAAGPISQGFGCLKGTIFENGIDAAFASHKGKEAYLFKGDSCVLIDFASATTDDKMLAGGVKKILDNWPSLRSVLPRKCGSGILYSMDFK